jgi:flavodoxin
MKILITYFSQTGNTAQVAQAIREAVASQGHEVTLQALGEVSAPSLSDFDLVFLGSTCHSADLAKPAKELLAEVIASPPFKLAGFVTHSTAMPDNEKWGAELYERWAGRCIETFRQVSQEKQITFLGYFHCQGAPSPQIEVFIHNTILTDDDAWAEYITEVRGHPDKTDLLRAGAFAAQILNECQITA